MGGVYAIKVSGQLPDEIRTTLEEEYRIQYIPCVMPRVGAGAWLTVCRRDGTETETDS